MSEPTCDMMCYGRVTPAVEQTITIRNIAERGDWERVIAMLDERFSLLQAAFVTSVPHEEAVAVAAGLKALARMDQEIQALISRDRSAVHSAQGAQALQPGGFKVYPC